MIFENKKGFFQIQELILPRLVHGFSTKEHGNMSYKYGVTSDDVNRHRLEFARQVGFDLHKVSQMGLVHSTTIAVVSKKDQGSLIEPKYQEEVDGLVTDCVGMTLWLLTGDCAPYLLYDPKKRVIGLVHSGWKGTVGKIAPKAVAIMVNHFGCNIENVLVGIGPSIEKCCYVNSRPTMNEYLPEWSKFVVNDDETRAHVDLNGFTIHELSAIGLPRKNIFYSNFCTNDHSDRFFCAQRETTGEDKPGRFATIIQMTQ